MKRVAGAALLLTFTAAAGAMSWSDLWLRKDQQAEAALEAGQAAAAANLFEDPRLRGYADLKAQRYAEAAKQLAPLPDPESQYNRGNALARGGELRAALGAYDAALKKAPPGSALMRDAKANRDLVARQLQEQQQHGSGKNQSGQPPGGSGQSGKNESGKDESGKDGQSASQDGSAGPPPQSADQAGAPAQQSQASSGSSPGAPGPSAGANPDGTTPPRQPPASGASRDAQPPPQPGDAEQARQAERDARAALDPASRQTPPAAGSGASSAGSGSSSGGNAAARAPADVPPKPPTEQALALDQWLRWIPDDPGGLLRRKFLIEHMMKQRDAAP